jgi:RNA-splicing ligase RtcB
MDVALIHSGSRGPGETVPGDCVDEYHGGNVAADSFAADKYFCAHDFAMHRAHANRTLIAQRFVAVPGAEGEC